MNDTTTNPVPIVLDDTDFPGPLSHRRLTAMGTVTALDEASGFWSEYASSLYGRAQITAKLTPFGAISCALSAAWVWLGGAMPDTVDVLSDSHFRTPTHGHRIRVFNRRPPAGQVRHIGDLQVTAPPRTVVDLALIREGEADRVVPVVGRMIDDLMSTYHVAPADCLDILDVNPRLRHGKAARLLFQSMLAYPDAFNTAEELDDSYGCYEREEVGDGEDERGRGRNGGSDEGGAS